MAGHLKPAMALLAQLQSRLHARHPKRVITERSQRVDELESRLVRAVTANLSARQSRLQQLQPRLNLSSPRVRISALRQRLALHHSKMRHSVEQKHLQKKMLLQGLIRSLEGLSPLATLARGYAVLFHDSNIVTDPEQLKAGDLVTAEVAHGRVNATVQSCEPHTNAHSMPNLGQNKPH
jgi:exodeoxyribonuclease VII large subunit